MAKKRVADVLIETLVAAGVKRVYGLVGRSRPAAVFCIANRLRLFREHRLDARSLKAFQPQWCGLISSSVTASAGLFTAACSISALATHILRFGLLLYPA